MTTKLKIAPVFFLSLFVTSALSSEDQVDLLAVEGVIGPMSADFVVKAVGRAEKDGAQCLVIELDTPGGLDLSMRTIVKRMMAADVPIVVYVSPSGSRAASAGTFITLAAHFSAMAPGTNIGAAHPALMGAAEVDSTMARKMVNDAAAYIKAIAEKRGRNVGWAEDAVRKSVSSTEKEALELGVIDFVCRDMPALLDSLDGRRVLLPSGEKTLRTRDARVEEIEMGLRERILSVITDPNIAYILMILGFYGLLFELSNPGAVLPGVVGGICIILAFLAFQVLPINYAGLLLILFAIILFIADIKAPTHGILTVGGIISMILGSAMLFESPQALLRVSWAVIIPAALGTALFFTFAVGMGIRAQRRRPTTGVDGLVGRIGEARTDIDMEGTVFVAGEHWRAISEDPINKGEKVRVVGVDRSTLKVSRT